MTTLASRVVTLVRNLADDAVEPYGYGDTLLLRFLDDAQRELAVETLCLLSPGGAQALTATVTAASPWVTVPPSLIKLRAALSRRDGTGLRLTTVADVASLDTAWRTRTGRPTALVMDVAPALWRLTPVPVASDTLDLEGYVYPAAVTSLTSPLSVPETAVAGLHLGVLARVFAIADEDAPADARRAADALLRWEQFKRGVLAQVQRDTRATTRTVRYGGL